MSALLNTASGMVESVGNQLQLTTNRMLPPKQREQTLEKIRAFAIDNPKVAAFLAAQIALTGIPLVLFFAFAASVLLVSLTTALLVALTGAFLFTLFTVGLALLFVIPTLFIASCTATLLFVWSLGGYFVLQWFNEGEAPVKPGTKVGDKLEHLTGGRLAWLVDGTSNAATSRRETLTLQGANGSKSGQNGSDAQSAQGLENSGHVRVLKITDGKGKHGVRGGSDKVTNGHDFADE